MNRGHIDRGVEKCEVFSAFSDRGRASAKISPVPWNGSASRRDGGRNPCSWNRSYNSMRIQAVDEEKMSIVVNGSPVFFPAQFMFSLKMRDAFRRLDVKEAAFQANFGKVHPSNVSGNFSF